MKINKELTIIEKSMTSISKIEELKIVDSSTMKEGVEFLSKVNKYLDSVIKYKESKTKPLNEALKIIRAETKPLETKLENIISTLKAKISTYQTEVIKKEAEEQAKLADKLASGKISINKALEKMEAIEEVENKVSTGEGSVSFRVIKKFEVMDIIWLATKNGSPDYILPNEIAIRKAMNEGKELVGVRYYEEQSVINKRN